MGATGTGHLPAGHRAVDLGQAATDRNLRAASHNPKVAAALQRSPWLVMDAFVAQEGHEVMLALMHVAPGGVVQSSSHVRFFARPKALSVVRTCHTRGVHNSYMCMCGTYSERRL